MARTPTLRLGDVDPSLGMTDATFKEYLKVYYQSQVFPHKDKLLNESSYDNDKRWIGYRNLSKNYVVDLTRQLQRAGFMPHANHDGFFGYATQAAVRLFQEYVRTRDETIPKAERKQVIPDGMVGPITRGHLKRWVKAGLQPDWLQEKASSELALSWYNRFRSAAYYLGNKPTAMLKIPEKYAKKCDTLPPEKWKFSLNEPQLFGIRRKADRRKESIRENDDLFILLINGWAFTFFGSTDVNHKIANHREAFLIDGQHRYRYAWHKIGRKVSHKTYRALRPAGKGVIVVRDVTGHNALSPQNIRKGVDPKPNGTINIHWSGQGHYNYSAGCQVIGGRAYLDQEGKYVSCKSFAARGYKALGKSTKKFRTKGAYNLLADLLLIYGPKGNKSKPPIIRFTLLSEDTLVKAGAMNAREIAELRALFD